MKLATALAERADLQRRIAELSGRLNSNAKVQEGETPAEDPATLIQELNSCIERLEELMSRINKWRNLRPTLSPVPATPSTPIPLFFARVALRASVPPARICAACVRLHGRRLPFPTYTLPFHS